MFERRDDKHGTGRLRTALAIAAVTAVVASMAIVGTVAAQPGQRFFDVPRTHYAYQSIEWAVTNHITQGCGDGRNFCPDNTLNRAQMVTFLKRYHDTFGSDASDDSDDSDESDDSDDPEEHVILGFGSREESVSLPAGLYYIDFTLLRLPTSTITKVEVTVADLTISSERSIILVVGNEDDTEVAITETTIRDRGFFTVGRRLSELSPGRIYFGVEITGTSISTTDWEIVISER